MFILCDRFRLVSPFGKDTIRRFSNNASQMKSLAATNLEDLLQCALPVLEGLLPTPHGETIQDLVFVMGCWHAYAKLRLHTELTLASFEHVTKDLGILLHHFAIVMCEAFKTIELPKERLACLWRTTTNPSAQANPGGGPKAKSFNLKTYKLHALGEYPWTIRECGTTDNYTSAWVRKQSNHPTTTPT